MNNLFGINGGKYEKNLENIYEILTEQGDVEMAIKNAKRLEAGYDESDTPSKRKPATMVYALVEELFEYLKKE